MATFAKRTSKIRKTRARGQTDEDDNDDRSTGALLTDGLRNSQSKRPRKVSEAPRPVTLFEPREDQPGEIKPSVEAAKDSATRVIDVDGPRKSGKGTFGPQKATLHIRSSIRFDYQPDVCKDYKETGYCGFGDSCKFLHDRSDYKSGWEQDKSWEIGESGRRGHEFPGKRIKQTKGSTEESQVPFACHICRNVFHRPVQTPCGHVFCEACALQEFEKSPKCVVCGLQTRGIFNVWKKPARS